jgi:NitT/TauT family transport system permease protein
VTVASADTIATTASLEAPPTGDASQSGRAMRVATFVLSFAGGIGIWYIAAAVARSTLFPTPVQVASAAASLTRQGVLVPDILASLQRVAIGFSGGILAAIPVGFAMAWYRWVRGALEPWIQFLRAIPPLAMIPLVIILLGIGELPKYLVIGLAAFLPTTVAVFQGVVDVDSNLINAARVLGAPRRAVFARVVIPASSPMILTGMRIALGNAWATLVAAELIASHSGLGYMTSQGQLYFDVKEIYVGIVAIGILGILMDRIIYLSQQRLTSWQERR